MKARQFGHMRRFSTDPHSTGGPAAAPLVKSRLPCIGAKSRLFYVKEMSLEVKELRRQIVEIGRLAYQKGWVAANDGNISVRLGPDRVLSTPTGVSKGMMAP